MANYVESATLKLVDQTSGPANQINAALKRLHATARTLNTSARINVTAPGLERVQQQLQRLSASASKPIRITTDTSQANRQLDNLRARLNRLNASNRAALASGALGTGQYRGNAAIVAALAAAARNQSGKRELDAFMRNFRSANGRDPSWTGAAQTPLQRLGRGAVATGQTIRPYAPIPSANISQIATAILGAAALTTVVRSIASGILTEDDAKLRLRLSGNTETQIAEKLAEARRLSTGQFRGVSAGNILDASLEAANQAITEADVGKQMALVARNAQILAAVFKDTEKGAQEARQLGRVLGRVGVGLDPVAGQNFSDQIIKAVIASGGDVTISEVRRMAQQLKSASIGITARGLSDLVSLRDEGGRQGTADARSFIQDTLRSNLNKRDKAAQIEAGIRDASGVTKTDVAKRLADNPVEFVFSDMIPKLRKLGANLDNAAEVSAGLRKIGYTEPAVTFGLQVVQQREQIEADRRSKRQANVEVALGDDTSIRGRMARLDAQLQNVAGIATEGLVAPAGRAAKVIEDRFADITKRGGFDATDVSAVAGGFALAMLPKLVANAGKDPMSVAALTLVGAGIALTTAAGALLKFAGFENPFTAAFDKTKEERAKDARDAKVAESEKRIADITAKLDKERRLPVEMRDALVREREQKRREVDDIRAVDRAATTAQNEAKLREKLGSPDKAQSDVKTASDNLKEITAQIKRNNDELADPKTSAARREDIKANLPKLEAEFNANRVAEMKLLERSASAAILAAIDAAKADPRRNPQSGDDLRLPKPAPVIGSGDELRAPLLQNDTRLDKLVEAFNLRANQETTGADRLSTVSASIKEASVAVGESGTTAANAITSGAAAAGAAYGSAAAAQISAAVANVSVTVNPQPVPANIGTQGPR